jgi:hypothetical protein
MPWLSRFSCAAEERKAVTRRLRSLDQDGLWELRVPPEPERPLRAGQKLHGDAIHAVR